MATTEYIQASTAPLDVKAAMETLKSDASTVGTAQEANIVSDLGNLRTAIVYILGAMDTLATKLNADAGVTDTNYVTTNASGHTPAAIATV